MNRYFIRLFILLLFIIIWQIQVKAQPNIGTYPPQIHQQICRESTFTRYLDVFNTGDATLIYSAGFVAGPFSWVTASPLIGEIEPGDTIQVEFDFNSAGLPIDNYYADLLITSNDPDDTAHVVLAMLHVQDLTIFLEPDEDSICQGCSTKLNTAVFGCSEVYSFSWESDPPGFYSTEKSPVVNPLENTTYTVTVTDGGYSSQNSVLIQVYGASDVTENQSLPRISIYPNPAHDIVTLTTNSELRGMGTVRITDLYGRVVFSADVALQKLMGGYVVNPGKLIPGVYILSIEGEKNKHKSLLLKYQVIYN